MHEWLTLSICILTALVTYRAFQDPSLKDRLLFRPQFILGRGEWYRLFSPALIHANWIHAGFNLFALYMFGKMIELVYGWQYLLIIYIASLFGSSLLSLWLHRNHNYAALGASGGICGIIFSSIFLVPGTGIGMLFIPFSIPGNIFALLYLAGTFYALRKGYGNVGHDAHFGGAVIGLLSALIIAPQFCFADPFYFGAASLLSITCLGVLSFDPLNLSEKVIPVSVNIKKPKKRLTGNKRYDDTIRQNSRKEEIDRILDKVSETGLHSLTEKERHYLQAASRKK